MEFTSALNWQIYLVIILFMMTSIAKFLGNLELAKRIFPVWLIPFGFLMLFCISAGYIKLIALPFISILIMSALYIDRGPKLIVRVIAGLIAGITFLAMGFHVIPEFNNQLIIDAQTLKKQSSGFTQYFNFDKTLGGLIFFLMVVPSGKLPDLKTVRLALNVTLLTTFIVLAGGYVSGLIVFSVDYLFPMSFFLFFIVIQLFSVCLAEETFFRGFIQYRLGLLFPENSTSKNIIPLVIASLFFGVVHYGGGLGYVIAATIAGLGYGLVYQITKRVEASIMAHTFLNFIHLILFTYPFKL